LRVGRKASRKGTVMRTSGKWLMVSALAGFALSVTMFAPMASGQAPAAPAAPGGGQGRAAFGGQGGQGRGGGMRNAAQTVDPAHSAITTLLNRNDVKSEIMLSQRQSEDMTAAEQKAQADLQQKVQAARLDRNTLQGLSQDERRAKQQEARQKQQEIRQAGQTEMDAELDKKAQEVLKPDQIKRLHELDLQWRGPLALADPKVAEPFNLTADQKTKITAMLEDYHKTQQDTMSALFPRGGNGNGNGGRRNRNGQANPNAQPADPGAQPAPATPQAAPAAPQTPADPAALQAKIDEAKGKVDKAREEIGTKVLALLTEEQKTAWTTAQGKKFTFRKHDS